MIAFPHSQRWDDWVTQAWNMAFGRRWVAGKDDWIVGPRGELGGVGEKVIAQIAAKERLVVERNGSGVGLMDSAQAFGALRAELHPEILKFYTETSDYDFEVWTRWQPVWGAFGKLVDRLFARRLEQLCLPHDPLATSRGISSEVIVLRQKDGRICHRVWLRKLISSGGVIYSGFYSEVTTPAGVPAVKVVFPLPKGSATVVMRATSLAGGGLRLESAGRRDGDAGFYFVVEDRKGGLWLHYLRAFHERIDVYVDPSGTLRADHTMRLFGRLVYSLHYKITRQAALPLERVTERRSEVAARSLT